MPIKYGYEFDRSEKYPSFRDEWIGKYSYTAVAPKIASARNEAGRQSQTLKEGTPSYYSYNYAERSGYIAMSNAIRCAQKELGIQTVAPEDAVDLMELRKAEETEWFNLFSQELLSPDMVSKALSAFEGWVDTVKAWYPGSGHFPYLISPHKMINIVNAAAAHALSAAPELSDEIANTYQIIHKHAQAEIESGARGPYINMLEKTEGSLSILSKNSSRVNFYFDRPTEMINLLALLTEKGTIDPALWYRYGINPNTGPVSFEFAEGLASVLAGREDEVNPWRYGHERYYEDANKFAARVLEAYAVDERRNTGTAQGILALLKQTHPESDNPAYSMADFINVANAAIKMINKNGDTLEPIDKSKAESLPIAMLFLGSLTRPTDADEELADQLEYEETIYSEVLSFCIGKALKEHADWFQRKLQKNRAQYKRVLPRAYAGNGVYPKNRAGHWKRWRPGYGRLT